MSIPRSLSSVIQRFLDDYLPPVLRESRWFMSIPMRLLFKDKATVFLDFKANAYAMTNKQFANVYKSLEGIDVQGETDLNAACTEAILRSLTGDSVLEVGCGRGYLAGKIADRKVSLVACDIVIPKNLKSKYPNIQFKEADMENLPFEDKSFDTVVTTHTLEHVRDLPTAMSELRRVTKKRLIIVVPRQRPYTYNFSLHLNFFSHVWSFPALLGYHKNSQLQYLGDWLYIENY